MTELEFSFDEAPWLRVLSSIPQGSSLSAVRFLTLMEDQTEEQVEDALLYLESAGIKLDVTDLPKAGATGEAALAMIKAGADAMLVPDGDSFTVTVQVSLSPQFFAWLCGFGDSVKIESPQRVIDEFKEHIDKIKKNYR